MLRFLSVTYDRLNGGQSYRCRKVLEKTQWMKKEELRRLQLRRLKVLLTHAYENVSYYHDLFKQVGFRPGNFKDLADMQKIPVLRRSDLRVNFNDLIARNANRSDLILGLTTGTTAAPQKFYHGRWEVVWYLAAQHRAYGWTGYETGDKVLYLRLFGSSPTLARPWARITRLITRWKLLGGFDFSEKSIASFLAKNRDYRPDFVHGGAGTLNILSIYLLDNAKYTMRPKAVISLGQQLLPEYRRTIEKAFNCKVYDVYSATEAPDVAAQCGHHEGLHVAEENFLLEVEKNGEVAAPGEEGRVLLTGLNGFGMPLVRYDIGDKGKMLEDDCSCGRGLSLFKPFGRTYEFFLHSDGSFTIFRDLETIFEDMPIQDYQIEQESLDEIVIRIVKRAGYRQAHTDFILKKISFTASDIVKVRVELIDSVPLIGFGKVPHFVSKIPTKYV